MVMDEGKIGERYNELTKNTKTIFRKDGVYPYPWRRVS